MSAIDLSTGKPVVLPDAVEKLIADSSQWVARAAAEDFEYEMQANCVEVGLESPIEMLMWVALHAVIKVNGLQENRVEGRDMLTGGIDISPQVQIGKYRVDFLITSHDYGPFSNAPKAQIIVECDGTAFHERSEAERRREKKRDRWLQRQGYKILRFTGKEIIERPFEVATEILDFLEGNAGNVVTPHEHFNG